MTLQLFKCAYCLLEKNNSEIGGTLNKNLEKLILQKNIWEEELAKISAAQLTIKSENKRAEIDKDIQRVQKDLRLIHSQINNNNEFVCKTCWKRFENKNAETFICAICKQNITGKKLGGHVENYQDEGISVRKWSFFCQSCKDTRIIEANIYCPRKGDGRDGDWDITRPLFDCDCPIPEEKQII